MNEVTELKQESNDLKHGILSSVGNQLASISNEHWLK